MNTNINNTNGSICRDNGNESIEIFKISQIFKIDKIVRI